MKTKIEKLTPAQEKKLAVYRDRWLEIGLSTKPADRAKAEDALTRAYKIAGFEKPQIVWTTSPLAGSIVVSCLQNDELMKKVYAELKATKEPKKLGDSVWTSVRDSAGDSVGDSVWTSVWTSVGASVRDSVGASVGDSVWTSVRASVWDSVWDSVGASVRASVGTSVGDSVRDSVGDSVWASVGASVGDSVWASVGASVRASVGASVGDSVWASVRDSLKNDALRASDWGKVGFGQHDANWLGFYQYFLEVLKIEVCEKLIPFMDLAKHANWFFPYKNICVVSEKPIACNLLGTRIHCDGGPAVAYSDGFAIWALNGIRVPKEIAETPSDQITKEMIVTQKNADIRREVIRKVGPERMLKLLDYKVIDSFEGYELISFDIGDGRVRPWLKMTNPSIQTVHVEGILPTIKTVKEALAWRNGIVDYVPPVALT